MRGGQVGMYLMEQAGESGSQGGGHGACLPPPSATAATSLPHSGSPPLRGLNYTMTQMGGAPTGDRGHCTSLASSK